MSEFVTINHEIMSSFQLIITFICLVVVIVFAFLYIPGEDSKSSMDDTAKRFNLRTQKHKAMCPVDQKKSSVTNSAISKSENKSTNDEMKKSSSKKSKKIESSRKKPRGFMRSLFNRGNISGNIDKNIPNDSHLPKQDKTLDVDSNQSQNLKPKNTDVIVSHQPSTPQIKELNPPSDVSYSYLRVFNGKLMDAVPNKASYYRKWTFKGVVYYEFFCDATLVEKAINNKSALVEPYCDKHSSSIPYDSARSIKTVEFGILNSDNSIIKKTIIKYI